MALVFRPHTVTVFDYAGTADANGVAQVSQDGASLGTVLCQVTPESAQAAFDEFGVECENPYFLMCNLGDASKFAVPRKVTGTIVVDEGSFSFVWRVKTKPNKHLADPTGLTNYCSVLLEEIERA